MLVLVTGGAGFIGSFVVDRLLAEGHTVRVLDALDPQVHPAGRPAYLARDVDLLVGDVRDRATVQRALAGVDAVVHAAAAVGVGQSLYRVEHYVDVNVRGTATLLDCLQERDQPLRRFLVFTSMTGYGEGLYRRPSDGRLLRVPIRSDDDIARHGWEPACPETGEALEPAPTPEDAALLARNVYALTKRWQEELALALGEVYGFPVVCLRLFNVYGPRQSLSNPYTGVLAIFLSRCSPANAPWSTRTAGRAATSSRCTTWPRPPCELLGTGDADGRVLNLGSGVAHVDRRHRPHPGDAHRTRGPAAERHGAVPPRRRPPLYRRRPARPRDHRLRAADVVGRRTAGAARLVPGRGVLRPVRPRPGRARAPRPPERRPSGRGREEDGA